MRVGHVMVAGEDLFASVAVLADAPLDPCFVARDSVDLVAISKLDAEARTLATAVLEAGDLEVREDHVELRITAHVGDPARLEGLLRKLARLAARLRRGAGPYR